MKLKLQITILLVCLTVLLSAQISFKAYTSNNGLVNNTVLSIGQDGEGFMWFGTATGLSRFDGKSFTSFQYDKNNPNSVPGGEIRQIITGTNGDLWLISSGKIARFNKKTEEFEIYSSEKEGNLGIYGYANSLYNDAENLLLCTSEGLFRYNYKTDGFEALPQHKDILQSSGVYDILKSVNGDYWVIKADGIYIFPELNQDIDYQFIEAGNDTPLSLQNYRDIVEGSDANMYIGCFGRGVLSIDKKSFAIKPLPVLLSSTTLRSMALDSNGKLWMATELGINIYNCRTNQLEVCKQDFNNEHSLNDNAVYPIFKDKHNNIWAGTYFGGVNVNLAKGNLFKHYKAGEEPHFLSGKAISQIVEDKKGNLWIGTEDGGINYFDTKLKTFKHYSASSPKSVSYVNVHSLHIDIDENLWIGTYLGGLNVFDGTNFKYFRAGQKAKNWLPNDHIYALNSDRNHNVLVGSSGGLCVYDNKLNEFKRFSGDLGWAHIYDIYKSSDQGLWVATTGRGLFYRKDINSEFKNLRDIVQDTSIVLPNRVIFITESSDGLIWFGTMNDGLFFYDRTTNKVKQFTKIDGLPDNTIYAIVEDDLHNLWLTTNNGLVRYYRSENYFRVFTTDDGLPNNQFNYKSGFRHSDGTIYLGSVDGLIAFNPNNIQFNDRPPDVKIVSFSLFNETIIPNDKYSILKNAIFNTNKIELRHDENVIAFEFTAIDFTAPETNQFAYKMEGLEENWNTIGNYNRASFSHLPPGNYTFRVKASNNDGIWNEEGASIQIVVRPPFWLSTWGYILYGLIVLLILWIYRKYTLMRAAEKSALEREKMEKEKLKEINQLKLKFYTNVSHEFRTPLSLIVDPLQKMAEGEIKNPKIKNTVAMVLSNAQRLQILVNQLLDFRKTESGKFQLKVREENLKDFAKSIYSRFIPLAEKKKIEFCFSENEIGEKLWFDKKILDIVFNNLLSNAFKFTPEGGTIELKSTGDTTQQIIRFVVSDSGSGIAKENLSKIFERFYQVEGQKTSESGSGIGLALTKSLCELHHGKIWVESDENIGTQFFVEIPANKDDYQSNELETSPAEFEMETILVQNTHTLEENKEQILTDRTVKVLLVEDNPELQNYIDESLQESYKTITADNGRIGWEKVLEHTPDIIISDVMMPEMDGFELCKKVKIDIRTSHIPVILLTAKSGIHNQTEGLKLGADIYLEKPFNSNVLLAHLNNLIKLKKRFIKRFESELGIDVAEVTHSTKDEEFIKKAIQVIFEHIDDTEFNVTALIDKMAVSRSLLHMKLKEITGKSASEFVRFIRLKEAARILQHNNYTISEVAIRTGFSDSSYFSKSFKKQFEVTPKEYQKKYEA